MPTYTYPGVYIEEIPSGVHTITGVATSIAVFAGWAAKGPTDQATLVQSFTEFQALFGGLDSRSYLGYAVNQFFANGGQQAYIIRVLWDGTLSPASGPLTPAATARAAGIGVGKATISATSGNVSQQTILNVGNAVLQSIAVTPASPPSIQPSQTQQFTATGTYSDGTTKVMTSSVTWNSGTPSVAAISPAGLATAVAAGSAVITATSGAVSGTATLQVSTATLTSIAITPANPTLSKGQAQQLKATGTYSDGTSVDLTASATWTSGTPANASVSTAGLVTGLLAGTSSIAAGVGGVSGNTTVTVAAAALQSIAVTPTPPPLLAVAGTQQFKAMGTYSDGTTQDVTATATWSSANTGVATITTPAAVATAVSVGTSVITATVGTIKGTATLAVSAATLSSIAVTPSNPSMTKGSTQQFKAIGTYSDGTTLDLTASATWASATATVATITANGGLASGAGTGTSLITGTFGGKSGNSMLTVAAATLQSIAITPTNPSILPGQTQQFKAVGTFSDSTTQDLTSSATWKSDNTGVATINAAGLATAAGGGGTLTLWARNPGQWANSLQVGVTLQTGNANRFSVQVLNGNTGTVLENFVNLSVTANDPQFVVTVINNDSQLITFVDPTTKASTVPTGTPAPTTTPVSLSGGADGALLVPGDENFELALGSDPTATNGVHLLDRVDIFNLLCVPGETDSITIGNLQKYCTDKRAFYIVDSPQLATTASLITTGPVGTGSASITGVNSKNSAYYFPWVEAPDPLFGNRPRLFPPCGFVAGVYAATDATRRVWKAPAGIDASLTGVLGLQHTLTDLENGSLNVQAINCLRQFKIYGDVVWGARSLQGNDEAGSEWKYIPIRRFALFLESSLYNGTQWVVFEPNAAPLWSQIRLNVGAFMQGLFLQGAFQGTTPQQAYFVKCDGENNPQASIDLGIVNILVGFAPLFPAEFVVIQIQQMAGQL